MQISAKTLISRRRSPVGTLTTPPRHTQCLACRSKRGANDRAQRFKETRLKLYDKRLISEPAAKDGITDDSLAILAAMGIGVVDKVPIQNNPRSKEEDTVDIKINFSLLKIETDATVIPNSKIVDRKSRLLKRGQTKLVKASDFIPFQETNALFKPDEPPTRAEQRRSDKKRAKRARPNCSGVVKGILNQQSRLRVKHMQSHFKIIHEKVAPR